MRFIFLILFLIGCSTHEISSKNFEGEWLMNPNDDGYEGYMTIKNCSDKQCEFNIDVVQYGHTCTPSGTMKFLNNYTASYYRKYYDAEIKFEYLSDDSIKVYYGNTHSYHAFCGMNVSVEGIWNKN